jgi:D-glycero-D-manno-heptose 1,7-bisphosphate phosphatase
MTPGERLHKALFLDRDGVINAEKNYVYRIEDFEFLPGIFDLCAIAMRLGYRLVVITNQAGIGRGYYSEADYQHLTDWMLQQFRDRGIGIDRVYYCPYHPTAGVGEYRRDSLHRKPNPGMLLKARDELGLDLSSSVLVGDKDTDIEAGIAAGVKSNIKLVPSGKHDPGRLEFPSLHAIGEWLTRAATDPNRSVGQKTMAHREAKLDKGEK